MSLPGGVNHERRKRCSDCRSYRTIIHFLKGQTSSQFGTCDICRERGQIQREKLRANKQLIGMAGASASASGGAAADQSSQVHRNGEDEATVATTHDAQGNDDGLLANKFQEVEQQQVALDNEFAIAGTPLMWGLHTNRSFNDSETQWIVRNSPGGISYQPRESWADRTIRFNLTFRRSNSTHDVHSRWWRSVFENDPPSTTSDTGQSHYKTHDVKESPDLQGDSLLETVANVGEKGTGEVIS